MFNSPTRNHISIIAERLGIVFFMLVIVGINSSMNNLANMFRPQFWRDLAGTADSLSGFIVALGGAGFLLLVALVLLISFLFWRKTFFYIEGQNFIYERRTLFKKFTKLPIANISTVNLQQSVFERLMGTSKVKIDLNSSHTANRTDFIFVLKKPIAEALRADLTVLKTQAGQPEALPDSKEAYRPRERIIAFSTGEVIRHKILSLPFLQALSTIFAVIVLPLFDGSGTLDMQNTLFVLTLGFIGWVFVLIWGILNLQGYRVERDDKNVYISCGAIKKTSYTFEFAKINAVVVKQPVLARIFGLYSIEVAVVGLGNENKETPQLCLLVNRAQMERVLGVCAPDFTCKTAPIPSNKAALLASGIFAVFTALVSLAVLLANVPYLWIISVVVFAVSVLGGWLNYKTKTIAFDDEVFHYSKGIFSRHKAMFKYGDIQDARIHKNFVTGRLNAGRMLFTILSGAKMKAHKTGYFELPLFDEAVERVVAHGDTSAGFFGLRG